MTRVKNSLEEILKINYMNPKINLSRDTLLYGLAQKIFRIQKKQA